METNCLICGVPIVTSEFDLKPLCIECGRDYYDNSIDIPEIKNNEYSFFRYRWTTPCTIVDFQHYT